MNHINTEIIRDRGKAPRLHIKPWDETVCSVMLLNPTRYMSIQPYKTEKPGFEYDVIFSKRPDSNVIAMRMDMSGLDFFYQPALTLEEKSQGCVRPPKVVGSYAVYHKTMAGDYTALGGKNYRAGKAFHLYRPRPIDAKGRWCWADLRILPESNLLTVTVPQAFLDNATYPIRHAAGLEFGYHTVGASGLIIANQYTYAAKATSTPAQNGTITAIFVRLDTYGDTFTPGLYTTVGNEPTTLIKAGTATTSSVVGSWIEMALSQSITSGTQYHLAVVVSTLVGSPNLFYDGSVTGYLSRDGSNIGNLNNPFSVNYTYTDRYASIYAIYDAILPKSNMFMVL